MRYKHKYTQAEIDFIKQNIKGRSYKELTDLYNAEFKRNASERAIINMTFIRGFKNGMRGTIQKGEHRSMATEFKKGQISWNKGKKKTWKGGEETQFKKGHKPHNWRPVGSERISKDGYIEVKIKEPKIWKMKHVIVWEEANGAIPKGHVVLMADRNKQNVNLDNLILVSRRKLLTLNQEGLIKSDAELTKTGLLIADLHIKINERKRGVRRHEE